MEDMLKQPNNQKDAQLLYIYGRGKDALGDHNTAMLAYRRAYEINPYLNPDLAKKLGAPSDPVPQQSKGTKIAALAGGGVAPSGSPSNPVAGLFSAAGQSTGPSDSALLASVQNKINSNDLEGAKKDLDEELGKNPSDGKAWFMSGTANEKQGSLEDASTGYRQATFFNVPGAEEALNRVNDLRAKPFLEEGDKKMQANNLSGANDSYKQATSMAPNNIEAHRKLLEAAKKLGDQKSVEYESETIAKLQKPKQTGAAGSSTADTSSN
jgi:tetratricopeptide (TPR) repeat protein